MNIGSLKSQVILQSPGTTQDAAGQPSTTWTNVATIWADIRHPGGLESIRAGAQTSVVKASVRIRHRTDVNSGQRFLFGTTAYNIEAVLPHSSRSHLDLVCEVVNVES